jgi:hypothetical protein
MVYIWLSHFLSRTISERRRSNHAATVYDGTCPKFRVMIAIGFIDLVRESIGRTQMLSTSAWHLVHWMRIEDDRGDADRYSIISTQSLQARLNSLTTGFSDEVITAVLASAAYAVEPSRI